MKKFCCLALFIITGLMTRALFSEERHDGKLTGHLFGFGAFVSKYNIYNMDGSVYAAVDYDLVRERSIIKGPETFNIRINERELAIEIFDSIKIDENTYKVAINGWWKVIKTNNLEGMYHFETWEEFLPNSLFTNSSRKTVLRKGMSDDSELFPGEEKIDDYMILEVSNDWIKVVCIDWDVKCESDPDRDKLHLHKVGWMKWRENGRILIDVYFM